MGDKYANHYIHNGLCVYYIIYEDKLSLAKDRSTLQYT